MPAGWWAISCIKDETANSRCGATSIALHSALQMSENQKTMVALACLGALLTACQSAPGSTMGPQQLVIRRGGTYTGSYRSTDSAVPCVSIETTEPVTLRDCVLAGAGDLIRATAGGATLKVIGCRGVGLPPSADQTRRGRFLEINDGRSVLVEHNYFEHTTGILIYQWSGDGSARQTLTVRYNSARNIDGRYRDGGGTKVSFLQLNRVSNLASMKVAWNQVINEPNQSLVEDNINIFNSGGTRTSPLLLHDNYIRGAYPYPATSATYTGSGITMDGDGKAPLTTTAYVEAYRNQVISTCNAAMNIAAGHDNHFHDNRLVTSGLLSNGDTLLANYAATAVWNYYKRPPAVFYNNHLSDNIIGFVHRGGRTPFLNRQDYSPGLCVPCSGTVHLPNPITLQTEQDEWKRWQHKLREQHILVGPLSPVVQRSKGLAARSN